jgi:hypothetical protein
MSLLNRRTLLRSAALAGTSIACRQLVAQGPKRDPLPVAAIVTEYRDNSHADVILGKILAGFDQQGGPGPALTLASIYTDQVPKDDMSRDLAKQHGFRIARSIDEAITLGTDRLRVAGVLSIGEHGDYPYTPETRQHMYPRRRFFDEIAACFQRVGAVAPVFNDKHLSYRWSDAKQIYDLAARMKIPLMAGSSLPVTWRRPPLTLPIGCRIKSAFAVGYGGLESYGFHALETLQCMVERRAGGESGVAAVRALQGDAIRRARDRGEWSEELFAAVLQTMPGAPPVDLRRLDSRAALYQLEYRDGLEASVMMANGITRHFGFAARLRDQHSPVATWFELQDGKPFGHFAYLVRAIEQMVHTAQPAYGSERTLLTTGVLDALMHSLAEGGKRIETPWLDVRYQPSDWPFANQTG